MNRQGDGRPRHIAVDFLQAPVGGNTLSAGAEPSRGAGEEPREKTAWGGVGGECAPKIHQPERSQRLLNLKNPTFKAQIPKKKARWFKHRALGETVNESSLANLSKAWLSKPPGANWLARTDAQMIDATVIDLLAKHIEESAVWNWYGTITFRDPRPARRTMRAQKARTTDDREMLASLGLEDSHIPIKPKSPHRPPPRIFDGIQPLLINGVEVEWEPRKSVLEEIEDPNTNAYTKPGWRYAQKVWDEFVEVSMGDIPLDNRSWVRVFEQQKRGVPHIHFLMTENEGSPRYMSMKDWLDERYGMSRIYPYKPALGAANYLCKYLLKDQGKAFEGFDIEFSPNLRGV